MNKLIHLLSSPAKSSSIDVPKMGLTSTLISPQSILQRLSLSNIVYSSSQEQMDRHCLKNYRSRTNKQRKHHRKISTANLWTHENCTSSDANWFRTQFLKTARKLQQNKVK